MKILITGGAGFIGINAASFYLNRNDSVIILDNFSRKGNDSNVLWLKKQYKNIEIIKADIRHDQEKLKEAVQKSDLVLHLAAQVAVTTSVIDPRTDFQINAMGTFNVLEAIRQSKNKPILIYSSTNKVYGELENIPIEEKKTRYVFKNLPFGVSEDTPLDFHSPYGCSKGAADQYVRDYSRIYGIRTIVFRQSCIYGPHQFGMEDQGWVAWFLIALIKNSPITIYGDGKQVRDLLYVDDLIRAYDLAVKNISITSGKIYNIGGGPNNTLSVWTEFRPLLQKLFNRRIDGTFLGIRPGDQPIFIADIRKAKEDFTWAPKISVMQGIESLYKWISSNKQLFL